MSTSVSAVTSHFPDAENGFSTTTSGSVASGATTVGLNSTGGYTNGEPVVLVIDPTDATLKQTFTGIVDTAGVQITGVKWTAGTNTSHAAGATVVDYPAATHIAMISKGIKVEHNQDGTHSAVTATSVSTDTISEDSVNAGVTVDGMNIKDSKLATNDSVVTANITDAAVTNTKLATTAITLGYAEVTADQTGISTIADLTSLTTTVTVPSGGRRLLVLASTQFTSATADDYVLLYLYKDGAQVQVAARNLRSGSSAEGLNISFSEVASAGSHTYKLRAAGITSVGLRAGATYPASILVMLI